MAVYKATYCQPYLKAIDPTSLIPTSDNPAPYIALTCQIDTSNKNITGYSIQIWDQDNKLIFPLSEVGFMISPISELSTLGATGINGSTLTIPFFQLIKYTDKDKNPVNVAKIVDSYNAVYCDAIANTFVDSFDNPISFSVSGRLYKWAVTLYQGDGKESTTTPASMDYSNISNSYYDMKLSSGTILGSTNKRIQMSGTVNEKTVLPDSSVVLQGRYMQLYGSNGTQIGTRAYIESYDSTYGHAYPASVWTNKNSQEIVNGAASVSFFKYSNDPKYVLASEEVDYATTSLAEVTPSTIQGGGLPTIDGYAISAGDWILVKDMPEVTAALNGIWIANASVAWTRVANYDEWSELIGKVVFVQNGMKNANTNWQSQASTGGTLLTTPSKLYGSTYAYVFTDLTTTNGTGAPIPSDIGSTICYALLPKTAASGEAYVIKYTPNASGSGGSWGSSGKVDIVDSSNASIVFGAQRGFYKADGTKDSTYNVYDPFIVNSNGTISSVTSTSNPYNNYSRLYFQKEEPITLFADKLTATVDYVISSSTATDFDGYTVTDVSSGQTALCTADWYIYSAQFSGSSFSKWEKTAVSVAVGSGIVFVNQGIAFGGRAWSFASASSYTQQLGAFQATVLHNSKTSTYVSPYVGMSTGMKLRFQNLPSETVPSDLSSYLPVLSVDTVTWAITHSTLSAPLDPAPLKNGTKDPYAPYKYDVVSYYQQSDINPFYAYSQPVIVIADANTSSDVTTGSIWQINARKLSLQGSYTQSQGASWESYQWELYASDGTLLQSTDKMYDQTMAVDFYGLGVGRTYTVVLNVTDSLGNTLTASQTFVVNQAEENKALDFAVTPDCDAQCIKIDYQDTGIVWPVSSATVSGSTSYVYTIKNASAFSSYPAYQQFDNSLTYYTDAASTPDGSYLVIGEYGMGDRLTGSESATSVTGSTSLSVVPIHVWNYKLVGGTTAAQDYTYLSCPIRYGLLYQNYFAPSMTSTSRGSYQLALADDSTGVGHDRIALQTKMKIGSNACGRLFTLAFGQTVDTGGNVVDSSTGMTLALTLPDDLVPFSIGGESVYEQNDKRNTIVATLTAPQSASNMTVTKTIGSGALYDTKSSPSAAYSWFDLYSDFYYYLQFSDADSKNFLNPDGASAEMLHHPKFVVANATAVTEDYGSPYYEKVVPTGATANAASISASTPDYPMGNLLFISASEENLGLEHGNAYYDYDRGFEAYYQPVANLSKWISSTYANGATGTAISEKGMNMATSIVTSPLCLFDSTTECNASTASDFAAGYYLDVYQNDPYQSNAMNAYPRHPDIAYSSGNGGIAWGGGKTVVFTVTGDNLNVLEKATTASLSVCSNISQTAGIRFQATDANGTVGYLDVGMLVE